MHPFNYKCLYFLGLSGLALTTLGWLGTTLSTVRDPVKYLNACDPSSLSQFKLVPSFARQAVCTLYSGLQDFQTKQNKGAYVFVSQLLRVGPLLLTILSFESFRQKTFWRKRGASLYLILAQILSGAVSVPLHFATLCYGNNVGKQDAKGKRKQDIWEHTSFKLSQSQGWSIFASVTLGYLVPLAYGVWTHWSNKSITVFLCFPLFVMTIHTVLPIILKRRNITENSANLPMILTAGMTALLSLDGHIKLLLSGIPFRRIFWPSHTSAGMTQDLHTLLLHDYAFVLLELASFIFLYTYRDTSRREKAKAGKLALLTSILAGPVAGLSVIWTMQELKLGSSEPTDRTSDGDERTPLIQNNDE